MLSAVSRSWLAPRILATQSRPRAGRHFFFIVRALIFPFCNFFRRWGYCVAGFLGVRLAFFDMTTLPSGT